MGHGKCLTCVRVALSGCPPLTRRRLFSGTRIRPKPFQSLPSSSEYRIDVDMFVRISMEEIQAKDVLQLMQECAESHGETQVWEETQRIRENVDGEVQKIQMALSNSLVVVGAFTLEDVLLPEIQPSPEAMMKNATKMLAGALQSQKFDARNKLIGFGRAVGDGALVATLHDVIVHPQYRNRGIGRKILRALVHELDSKWDVVDVGALVPCHAQEMFRRCNFGPDSEGSTTMILRDTAWHLS